MKLTSHIDRHTDGVVVEIRTQGNPRIHLSVKLPRRHLLAQAMYAAKTDRSKRHCAEEPPEPWKNISSIWIHVDGGDICHIDAIGFSYYGSIEEIEKLLYIKNFGTTPK